MNILIGKRRRWRYKSVHQEWETAANSTPLEQVHISIRDNGNGIPQKYVKDVFTPFFTTKPPGEGTGLGLSLSYDIIAQEHQGILLVETQPDQFTEFIIFLPKKRKETSVN